MESSQNTNSPLKLTLKLGWSFGATKRNKGHFKLGDKYILVCFWCLESWERLLEWKRMGERNEVVDDVMLPGFRFHPTDEELVGFYLKRKIQHRPLSIELIRQLDIYKYDPWDLPSKFWYELFFFFFLVKYISYVILSSQG